MNKYLASILLTGLLSVSYAQISDDNQFGIAGVSSIKIKNKKLAVYLSTEIYKNENSSTENDSIQTIKIAVDNQKYSEINIIKFKTKKGFIVNEGSYKVENDTLIVYEDMYDYIGAYRIIEKYIPDQFGMKKISEEMISIDTDSLPDNYLKFTGYTNPSIPEN